MAHAHMHETASEPEACQVCGGRDLVPEIEYQGMQYFRCTGCELVFLYPPPTPAELEALYSNPESGHTSAYFSKVESKERRARKRVRRMAAEMPGGAVGKRFLDVGCSGGFVTEAARERGFLAVGIDPDADAVAYAREHYPLNEFHVGMIEDFTPPDEKKFAAIYCSEVLEHVGDVNRFVAALSRLLQPGGLIYLTTPDIGHWRRPKDLKAWDVFTPPHHCVFFNEGNLRQLLARYGLVVYKRRPAFKPGIKVLARRGLTDKAA